MQLDKCDGDRRFLQVDFVQKVHKKSPVIFAGQGCGKVSLSALDKATEAVYSCKEFLADTMALSEEEKQEKLHLEKIRLNVVRTQIKDTLSFLRWLE